MSILDDFDNWNPRAVKAAVVEPVPLSAVQQVFNAASRGQVHKLRNLLEQYSDVDLFALINGLNAVHVASKKGHCEVIKALVSREPLLLRSRAHDLRDPYMFAAYEGQEAALLMLHDLEVSLEAELGAPLVEPVDSSGNTSLHYAAWGGHLSCVKFLATTHYHSSRNSCNHPHKLLNHDLISPLQFAAAGDHADIVFFLSSLSQSQSQTGNDGRHDDVSVSGMTAVHRAAAYGSFETVKLLVESQGLDPWAKTQNGSTALHMAAQHGHDSIVRFLCDLSAAQVDCRNDYGLTPLHFGCIA
jgi:ankyrin repeat protein